MRELTIRILNDRGVDLEDIADIVLRLRSTTTRT